MQMDASCSTCSGHAIVQSTFSEYWRTIRTRGGIRIPGFKYFHRQYGKLPQAAPERVQGQNGHHAFDWAEPLKGDHTFGGAEHLRKALCEKEKRLYANV